MAKRECKPSKEDGNAKGQFINPKDFKIGDWLISKDWGEFQVIDYVNSQNITIRFPDTGNTVVRSKDKILKGAVIDRVYVDKKVKDYEEREQKKRDSFDVFMETWNPISHHKDVFKLPYFYKCGERGWVYRGFTYVDEYTYNSLKRCRLIKAIYVQLSFSKFNCFRLGIKYKGRGLSVPLHCWVKAMPTGRRNLVTDHKNGSKLDNRVSNLRIATYLQNSANSKATASSGYRGVKYATGKFRNYPWFASQFTELPCGKPKCNSLGYYATAEEAAYQVDLFNIKRYGEFVRLNLKRKIYEDLGLLSPTPRKYSLPK